MNHNGNANSQIAMLKPQRHHPKHVRGNVSAVVDETENVSRFEQRDGGEPPDDDSKEAAPD